MSHVDAGPLPGYNSLLDPNLAGYFSNMRMKRHLMRAGLVTRRGEVVSENTYRLIMARKEHKRHVKDMLAQAIVHKTLDMERTRQVAVRKKLEEISKIELVHRVKGDRGRKGDEDLLPLLTPRGGSAPSNRSGRGSRPSSVPAGSGRRDTRPTSAPARRSRSRKRSQSPESERFYSSGSESPRDRSQSPGEGGRSPSRRGGKWGKGAKGSKYPREQIDDRHLYALDQNALRQYKLGQYRMERAPRSPYTLPQLAPELMPAPPAKGSPRSPRSARRRRRPATAESNRKSENSQSKSNNKGTLMLHRMEPAMKHQERVQTMCDVRMHYFGSTLHLDYERFDPRDEITVEQQHCGGNTLIVFREKILPGSDFTFTSRRHHGYPFSLTCYINGVLDCRVSACCEYKHGAGSRLGGKQGHFGMLSIEGAAPCYRCQMSENDNNSKKKKKSEKKSTESPAQSEEDGEKEEEKQSKKKTKKKKKKSKDSARSEDSTEDQREEDMKNRSLPLGHSIQVPVEDDDKKSQESDKEYNYSDEDFEEDNNGNRKKGSGSGSSSGSSSDSNSGSSDDDSSSSSSDKEDGPQEKRDEEEEAEASGGGGSDTASLDRGSTQETESNHGSYQADVTQEVADTPVSGEAKPEDQDDRDQEDRDSQIAPDSVSERRQSDAVMEEQRRETEQQRAETEQQREETEQQREETEQQREETEQQREETEQQERRSPSPSVAEEDRNNQGHEAPAVARRSSTASSSSSSSGSSSSSSSGSKSSSNSGSKSRSRVNHRSGSEAGSSRGSLALVGHRDGDDRAAERDVGRGTTEGEEREEGEAGDPEGSQAGGGDPDHVAQTEQSQQAAPFPPLGVAPGLEHEGSIRPLVADRKDVELLNVALTSDQVTELCDVLRDGDGVETVMLRNCCLDDERVAQLADALSSRSGSGDLKMLNLTCNKVTVFGIRHILSIVEHNPQLEIMLLHGNPVGDLGLRALVEGLLEIDGLRRGGHQADPVVGVAHSLVSEAVSEALAQSRGEEGHGGAEAAGEREQEQEEDGRKTLQQQPSTSARGLGLEQLDLGDCRLTAASSGPLADLLAADTGLAVLGLTGNTGFTQESWETLAGALADNSTLQTLSLDYTGLGDTGMAALARGLARNTSVESLDLEGNGITMASAQILLQMAQHSSLRDVTLMPGNRLSDALLVDVQQSLLTKP